MLRRGARLIRDAHGEPVMLENVRATHATLARA